LVKQGLNATEIVTIFNNSTNGLRLLSLLDSLAQFVTNRNLPSHKITLTAYTRLS
jgi:hypothetical protein